MLRGLNLLQRYGQSRTSFRGQWSQWQLKWNVFIKFHWHDEKLTVGCNTVNCGRNLTKVGRPKHYSSDMIMPVKENWHSFLVWSLPKFNRTTSVTRRTVNDVFCLLQPWQQVLIFKISRLAGPEFDRFFTSKIDCTCCQGSKWQKNTHHWRSSLYK